MAKSDVKNLSFESALAELESILEDLEQGSIDLEKSVELLQRSKELKSYCDEKLQSAKLKVETIVAKGCMVESTIKNELEDEYAG